MDSWTLSRRISVGAVATLLAAAAAIALMQINATQASAAALKLSTSSLTLAQANEFPRAEALCGGGQEPFGGGAFASPPPQADGEGVYPHSYERLGQQSGFHTTPVLFDPSPGATRSYQLTVQVLCAKKFGKVADPHDIALNVPSGTSVTLNAICPKRSVLIGGGFQRMAFGNAGGVYPTESRAISKTGWQASGTSFGAFGTDAVSIGYCMASPKRKPLLSEVSSSVAIAPGSVGVTTTPACTGGRELINNGFDTSPKTGLKQGTFFSDGKINGDQSFTASAWNGGAATSTLTAYGYCIKKSVIRGSLKKFSKKVGSLDTSESTDKVDQDGNPNG